MTTDYIIVGGGSAGCVLADRLSANPANSVLLLEAGPADNNPFIHMPRGAARLYSDPRHVWYFQTEGHDEVPAETWIRGKMLGGSSSVNGMMYFRGQPEDYDHWEALGAKGWGWSKIGASFRAMEGHELGGDDVRGGDGPLHISVESTRDPLSEAFIGAGEQMGIPRVADLNHSGRAGVGYTTRTIWKGKRQSAAQAFLKRARNRPNLRVVTGAVVDKVIFDGRRAKGVRAIVNGATQDFMSGRDIILSAGALMSPQILQRSGVGAAALLRSLGIDVVADSPGVGEHMLEHRLLSMVYDINAPHSHNLQLQGARLVGNVLRYYLNRTGPMAAGYGSVGAFATVLPESATPDIEILLSPAVAAPDAKGNMVADPAHSVTLFGYPLRSRSEGSVRISSADPAAPARIRAGYLTDPYDCAVTLAMHRYLREWMAQPAIAPMIAGEREPTRSLQTDEQILNAFRQIGQAGYHACGTCRMGDFDDAVLDSKLRVKGVDGLRVMDGSIMPTMVSANTNGPIMASAWNAADIILEGRNR
ncbi:GMC family oxidoreductase [Sphingobium yanoikuyae]|uniref:Glucose-methanol-choline oxidoreductase n=1 Tax=Sphingobium yanoikuyae TaxID=13690 RepID=A0A291N7B3_SPHYA|nr:GMC family oxidoreductase N-terminal domain-containing protein [Sphingobium yanoikuyae]ATI83294.1 glucose-methanol-choline oxidoreductase [Sphingobium yanoikuyae]